MAVTVRDLLKLETTRDFQLVAGGKGLDLPVNRVEILDFEFMEEGQAYRSRSFEGNSLVLTSFLYAKDRPELILDGIRRLWQYHVHAVAYKPVIYRELPQEALDYADRVGFPVFVFGSDAWFEDIVSDVKALEQKTGKQEIVEPLLESMMDRYFSSREREEAAELVNPTFRIYFRAYYARCRERSREEVAETLKDLHLTGQPQQCAFVCRFRRGYMIMVSGDFPRERDFEEKRDRIFALLGLELNKVIMGVSEIRRLLPDFDTCIMEAYWAEIFAEIEGRDARRFDELRADRLFIPWPESPMTGEYSAEYLKPLFVNGDDKSEELLSTAVAYVLAGGDMQAAAERMFCHKNTIRYRVGKLQEKLDPETSEKVFFQNLSAAVKIYLLMKEK
ncbi:MAG: PucR family transcriptional regulator ligand-binding domain-containing protein [Clostridiales bacterium]|nr:PucR family transcriptional regulator ligand-binding domain-containing protein [Clostridiales bacterium]